MSSGKLFAVGTIEEDFKKIGIFTESAPVAAAPVVVATVTESAKPAEKPVVAPPVEGDAVKPVVTEGMKLLRKRRLTGKDKMVRRKQKMLRRRKKGLLKRKSRTWRKSARGKRFLRKYKQTLARFHGHAPKGKRISLRMGLDKVSNLIEEVSEIVDAIDGDAKQETVKTFANIALIANKLAENYAYACENLEVSDEEGEELDLCGAAEHFESLAADSADLAEALHKSVTEGTEFEGTSEEVSETFSSMLSDVLEGLDVFADLSEGAGTEDAEPEESEESAEAEKTDEKPAESEESEESDETAEEDEDEKDDADDKDEPKKDEKAKDKKADEKPEPDVETEGDKKARPTK